MNTNLWLWRIDCQIRFDHRSEFKRVVEGQNFSGLQAIAQIAIHYDDQS